MLITTYNGIVVNTDYVAYIALKKEGTDDLEAQATGKSEPGFKVLLSFANGDALVAAAQLSLSAARLLRQDIARQWAEGATALDVTQTLERHTEGAYFAQDAEGGS